MGLDLIKKLDQAGQLDNSLIVYIQEHSRRSHESMGIPAIVFGSGGGMLKTGQALDLRNISTADDVSSTRRGYPMNQFYANLLMAMGLPSTEFEPLNRDRIGGVTSYPFKQKSGYGCNGWRGEYADYIYGGNYASWKNHDLSGWIPGIKA